MKERKYEVALMRTMGAKRFQLFMMVSLEGILIAFFGFIIGMFISHLGMSMLAGYLESTYQYTFTGMMFLKEEFYLFVGTLMVGFLAALIPAWQTYKTDISKTLSES